ncbi:MAG: hypothetical protein CMB79_09130 [Filomicrobium sp.]|nr:hypothetical protein [Filomicrobium sp.]
MLRRRHQSAIEQEIRLWPNEDFKAFLKHIGPMDPQIFGSLIISVWIADKGGTEDALTAMLSRHWNQARSC